LSKFKRLLGLRWGHRVQRRYFFKRLHDRDEDVEIQSQHCSDGINPAPRAREMLPIPRVDRYHHYDRRNNTKLDRRRDSVKRKEKTGQRCRDCGDQEPFGPTVETFAGEQSEQDDKTGKDRDRLSSV